MPITNAMFTNLLYTYIYKKVNKHKQYPCRWRFIFIHEIVTQKIKKNNIDLYTIYLRFDKIFFKRNTLHATRFYAYKSESDLPHTSFLFWLLIQK